MTFTYSGDPSSSDKDAIRFLLGDTDSEEELLSDEELIFLASQWTQNYSVYWAAAVAAESVAARFAREVTVNSDSQTVSTSELQQKYLTLAERMRSLHRQFMTGAGVDAGGMLRNEQRDPDVRPFAFGRAMHDNPYSGQQDNDGMSWREYLLEYEGRQP